LHSTIYYPDLKYIVSCATNRGSGHGMGGFSKLRLHLFKFN